MDILEDCKVQYAIYQGRTDEGDEIVVEFIFSFIATGIKDRTGGSSRFAMILLAGKGKGDPKEKIFGCMYCSAKVSNMWF